MSVPSVAYFAFRTYVQVYRKVYRAFIESELFQKNFPEKYARYVQSKNA